MTKVIEVINNVLSIASNKEIGLFIKLLIVLVVIVFFGVISFYKKKDSVIIGAIVVIIAILIVVVGEVRHCGEPGPSTPTPKETPTATIEKTDTEPAEISIQDANVLDDDIFYDGDMAEQDVYENVYDSYVWAAMGGAGFNPTIQSETYLLQEKYNRFTGKLFVRKEDPSSNSFIMKVYLDGVQKYKSEIITKEMGAYEFDCDITGANKVKVEFSMVDGDGVGRAFLADGKFVKD